MDVPLSAPGASVAAATSWWWLCWQCSRLKQLSFPPLSNATYFIAGSLLATANPTQLYLIAPTPKRGVPVLPRDASRRSRCRPRRCPRCSPHTTQATRPLTPTPNTHPFMDTSSLLIQASKRNMPNTNTPCLHSSLPRLPHRQQLACIQ